MRRQRRQQGGFTLIEIMVVVFIIGLLATFATTVVMDRLTVSKRTAAKTQIETYEQALNLFKLENGYYPSSAQGLSALVNCPAKATCPSRGYVEAVVNDPWGNPYFYVTNGEDVLITSYATDGRQGGDGYAEDITNRATG